MTTAALQIKARRIRSRLKRLYPGSRCSLYFKNPYELLIATILSAQCTDKCVNRVTGHLFKKYPGPASLAKANLAKLEEEIRPTGFFRGKARSIKSCAGDLVKLHAGKVPDSLEDLVKLAGVGRKTANVVLGNAFGRPAVVIETHVLRIAARLGLSREKDPVKMEFEFMELFPRQHWSHAAHLFIDHGRAVCRAPRPLCGRCGMTDLCDYYRAGRR